LSYNYAVCLRMSKRPSILRHTKDINFVPQDGSVFPATS
jgi:hypothetical protein